MNALSRDTKNANQRIEKQDLQKVQERQEMAKVIGDISNNAISISTYNEREKINKLGLEKFKLEEQAKALKGQAGNEQQLAAIKQQLTNVQAEITKTQGEIDRTYGIGSEKGMAIRAVTAALQAAAQNDTAGSLVTLASPYLNKTIHEMTAGDTAKDKAANLMAHALLSAVEFQVTGKDPLTGAVAGVTGEVTAQILTQAIYNKTPNQLTANEKENISTLSQLAGGLAAALTAKANGTTAEQEGSFLAATSGAETAKRAVENNYLSKDDWDNYRRDLQNCQGNKQCQMDINKKYAKLDSEKYADLVAACKLGGSSSKCQTMSEEARDGVDYAVQEFYKPMFDGRNELWLRQRIEQGYSDSKKEPSVALLGDESLNNLNDMAKNPKVLKKLKSDENLRKEFIDAVDESTLAVRMEKSNAYEFGEGLSKYKNLVDLTDLTGGYKYFNREIPLESVYPETFIAPFALRGAQAISSAEGLIVQGTSKVLPRVGMVAEKYPLLSELVVSGAINTGYQLSSKKEFSGDDLLKAELSTLFNRNKSLGQQTAINIGLNVMATTKPEDYGWNAISAVTGTLGSAAVSNGLSKVNISPSINKMIVPTGSAITSEYLGDAEKLKQHYRFLEEKYAK